MFTISKRLPAAGSILLALLSFTIFLSSCSKDKSDNQVSIEGMWQGSYGFGESSTGYQYAFKIFANGTMQRINGAGTVTGEGEWEIQNNIFMADFSVQDVDFSVIAAFDPAQGKLLGDWGYYPNVDEGRWEMDRVGN